MIHAVRQYGRFVLAVAGFAFALASVAAGQDTPVPQTPAPATRPALSRSDLDQCLRELSSPQYRIRNAASDRLGEASEEMLPVLFQAYQHSQDYELRLRLRTAIERVFYRKQLQGKMGFLGVQPRTEEQIFDPTLGKTVDVIFMTRVLPGFPAEKAGIKTGDMMLEFDGKPVSDIMGKPGPQQPVRQRFNGGVRMVMPNPPQIEAFTNDVSRRDPGSVVNVRLLRAETSEREVKFTVPESPARTLEGAGFTIANVPTLSIPFNEMLGPSMRQGICVASLDKNSLAPKTGLKVGDVIVGLGRVSLPPGTGSDQIKKLLENSTPGNEAVFTVVRTEQVKVAVTLGGRPVDRMNSGDMEIAQARFAEWWRERTGESSLRTSNRTEVYPPKLPTALPDPTMVR